jgi:glycosyltransferase involved in cell wall biosynthesis
LHKTAKNELKNKSKKIAACDLERMHKNWIWGYCLYKNQKVSVVFSTYNEKNTIKDEINSCFATGVVDEVIVVNNNAAPGTNEEVKKTKAKLFFEKKQGYGFGYRTALKKATGDIIIMSEPDGTFRHSDIPKLLVYSDEFDVVFGTRTKQATIMEGANMGFFLKWGNWFIAKLIEFLFNTTHISDAGCTMRLIKKPALTKIQPQFTVGTSHFGPEFMILVILNRIKHVEIPVHYCKRVGESKGTKNKVNASLLGVKMIHLILSYKFSPKFRKLRHAWRGGKIRR